jgi:hypothetical protein
MAVCNGPRRRRAQTENALHDGLFWSFFTFERKAVASFFGVTGSSSIRTPEAFGPTNDLTRTAAGLT